MSYTTQSITQLLATMSKKLFVIHVFNPEHLENNCLTMALETFAHFQYIFNILWLKGSLEIDQYWLNLLLGIGAALLEVSSKMILFCRGSLKTKRTVTCTIRLLNTIFIKALFLIAFEHLTRGTREIKASILFNLLVNYILTSLNVSFGYLRWLHIMVMFFITFLLSSGLSLKNIEIFEERYVPPSFWKEYHIALVGSNLLTFIIVAFLIRRRANSLESIEKTERQKPIGKVIIKRGNNEILFANETIYKILGLNGKNLSFADLNTTLTEHTPISDALPCTESESPVNGKNFHRKKLTLLEILDSLTHVVGREVLTFYTTVEQTPQQVLQTEGNLLGTEEAFQYEVKVSFLDWDNYHDKYFYIQYNNIKELQRILESEKQIEFKTKILHSFSHELKTPINISKNMINLMIMDADMPNSLKDKYASVIRESVDQLEFIIQDIIDFLKIESFQFQFVISKFCLKTLLQEVVESIQKRVEEQEIQIFLSSDINEDYSVLTDRTRLKRVLLNVLSFVISVNNNCTLQFSIEVNSLGGCDFFLSMTNPGKETAPQSIDLNLPKRPEIKSLCVQNDNDFGMMISRILLAKLKGNGLDSYDFENDKENNCILKFSTTSISDSPPLQVEPSFEKKEKSYNRMPAIAKFIRKERKSLTNPSNKKSLDLAIKHLEVTKTSVNTPEFSKPCARIMIVDDDFFNLLSLNLLLEKLRFFSIKASNGVEAIANLIKFQKEHTCLNKNCKGIELIIMDLMMPVMNGLECSTALIKMMSNGDIPNIPIIACTANDSKDIIERCQQIGIKDVLSKPISLETLSKSVSSFLL